MGRNGTGPGARRLLGVIEHVADSDDLDGYATRVVGAVAQLIPTDLAVTYCDYDQADCQVIRYAESAPTDASPEVIAAFWDLYQQHPLCGNRSALAQRRAITVSDFLDCDGFRSLEVYHRYYRQIGIEHQMLAAFPARTGKISDLCIHRASGDFTERERSVLDLLRPHLARARRVAVDRARLADLECAAADLELIQLGPGGTAIFRSSRGWALLAEYFDGHRPHSALPPEVASWAARSCQPAATLAERPEPDELAVSRDGKVLRMRVVPGRGPGNLGLLVLQEQTRSRQPALTSAALRLTSRERELLGLVADGLTNAQIGRVMFIAPGTVAKHLDNIYAKLAVSTRTAAVARVFGPARGVDGNGHAPT
jgi:DNA-binding CsgD family transcriptional regulator